MMRASPDRSVSIATENAYRQWIARFDQLWAQSVSEQNQQEMQQLLQQIAHHEAARALSAADHPLKTPADAKPLSSLPSPPGDTQ